jgi:hypothetical protein
LRCIECRSAGADIVPGFTHAAYETGVEVLKSNTVPVFAKSVSSCPEIARSKHQPIEQIAKTCHARAFRKSRNGSRVGKQCFVEVVLSELVKDDRMHKPLSSNAFFVLGGEILNPLRVGHEPLAEPKFLYVIQCDLDSKS